MLSSFVKSLNTGYVRDTKRLLEILLLNIHMIGVLPGLCAVIVHLEHSNVISREEADKVYRHIIENKPKAGWFFRQTSSYESGFYFTAYKRKPRIKYLKQLIKKERNESNNN